MVDQVPEHAVYALLADGATIEIRTAQPGDLEAVRRLHADLSPESFYRRFFGFNRTLAEESARRICHVGAAPADSICVSLLALLGGKVIGVAEYDTSVGSDEAEFACTVAEGMGHRGVTTLLLEHLVPLARQQGIRRFTADILLANRAMLKVLADLGLHASHQIDSGVRHDTIPLVETEEYREAVAVREHGAEVASLWPAFHPASVAVIGASREEGTAGRVILDNILSYGFTGAIYAVNPHAPQVSGVACYPSVDELPATPELAVVAVPAAAVVEVAEACGRRGVSALVVVTSGLDAETGCALLTTCRRHGMRLVGPNCLGIATTDPQVRLDATFAAHHPTPGSVGLAVQSSGVGIAMLEHLSRLGIGISIFASLGDKCDVSTNDLLELWEGDGRTTLGMLYVESFGNPRKFARTARRVSRSIPLLTVSAGRSEAGQRAAASHTAAVATATAARDALFTQAGVIATSCLAQLVDAAALLVCQPLPLGERTAILTNVGGVGVLAADACTEAGLAVPEFEQPLRKGLAALLPEGAAVGNPIDATPAVTSRQLSACLERVCASDAVDAVLVLLAPTALGDLTSALTLPTERHGKPVLVVFVNQEASVRTLRTQDGQRIPAYSNPATAAQALGRVCRYARWRRRDPGREPVLPHVHPQDVAHILQEFLRRSPEGGWLPPDQVAALLGCYDVSLVASPLVTREEAVAAGELGYRFADRMIGTVVQPMLPTGVELLAGVTHDEVFGPLVVFGYGGVATEVFGDYVTRLTPLTEVDAAEMVRQTRCAPLLFGYRGSPAVDVKGLEELLLRLSRLADDHPQIAELHLNPVIARPEGLFVVDARVRVHDRPVPDPYLRRLRPAT